METLLGPSLLCSSASPENLMGLHGYFPHRPVERICYCPIVPVGHFLASINAELATTEVVVLSLGAEAVLSANGLESPICCPIYTKDPWIVLNPSAIAPWR